MATREPTRIVTAHRQREGAGFIVRRPVPTRGLDHVDPFLMIDEMGPNTEQEIIEAIRDYQSGRMGEITRTAEQR